MKRAILAAFFAVVIGIPGYSNAQTAGSTTLGVTVTELEMVLKGWSAKKMILGKPVYNDKNEKIGDVEDIIITPDKSVSYGIIGVGGFLGMGERYVAIPVNQIKIKDKKFILPGATKQELEKMPQFEYRKK